VILVLTTYNKKLQDINRNLHYVYKNELTNNFMFRVKESGSYTIKLKPSYKEYTTIQFKINSFIIRELYTINNLCDKVYIINMQKEYHKYSNISHIFELSYIKCERLDGVDGLSDNIKKKYEEYTNNPMTEDEKTIGRKSLESPGAMGYLYSMKKAFEAAIINQYEYIAICDDDVGLSKNFIHDFDRLVRSIKNFRILQLGSSQWTWNDIEICDIFYYPNAQSNGSFFNIYHRSCFDDILNNLITFNSPFDNYPLKNIYKKGNCYTTYPNLAIAQLETSHIRKHNNNRTYERFRWNKDKYQFAIELDKVYITVENIKPRHNNEMFLIGITTYNRLDYLKSCIESFIKTLNAKRDYILIFASGTYEDESRTYLNELSTNLPKNISIVILINPNHYIYRQSNSILKYSEQYDYDFGFILNDDIIFKVNNWDTIYYETSKKKHIEHLVFFDTGFKIPTHYKYKDIITSYCTAIDCQGALFTFTKKLIDTVGFFDEDNFKIRGHSHIDFTIRCCRAGFNDKDTLWDIKNSNKYLCLNNKAYVSSLCKLPILLRDLHKVDIYELERRLDIINIENRQYININFNLVNYKS